MRNARENADALQRLLKIEFELGWTLSYLRRLKEVIEDDEGEHGDCIMVSDGAAREMSEEFSGWAMIKNINDETTITDLKVALIKLRKDIVSITEEIERDVKC